MDRIQMIIECARMCFADSLDDVLHMVRQDRQHMHGWEEPAHMRAVVRRTIREQGGRESGPAEVSVAELEFGRAAGEPERGEQREALGQLLDAGAAAIEKISQTRLPELSSAESLGLECVLLLYGRPALLVSQGELATPPPFWKVLEDQSEEIELVQRGVGRIELLGHPELDWAGTGFLVSDTCLMTTRRTAELFAERTDTGQWQFRPGISAWMDYQPLLRQPASAAYRIHSIVGVHERYDFALLAVEPPQQTAAAPLPLVLSAHRPREIEGRPVYLVGYPACDARRNEPERIVRIFRDVYNVKRVQPGTLRGLLQFRDVNLLQHDCAMLGNSTGSCLVDLETHQVLGLHLSGRYLEKGTAIPLWELQEDPLLKRAGVTFTGTSGPDLRRVLSQLERLARTRFWNELQASIGNLYQRAFGG